MSKKKQAPQPFVKTVSLSLLNVADSLSPFVSVAIRLWIAKVFWYAGLTKIANWDTTLFLFEEEYQVPLLPYELAAYLGTANELILPVLLVIGLGARFAALGLLFMTAVIEFTYQSNAEHLVWAIFLSAIALQGAGRFSVDYFISKLAIREVPGDTPLNNTIAVFMVIALTIFAALTIANDVFA